LKKDDLYLYEKISDKPYLLPFGQKIADHKKGVVLNESSSFLIELLEKYDDIDKIKECFFQKYDVSEGQKETVTDDILFVLSQLNLMGAVKNQKALMNVRESEDAFFYKIGKIVLSISGPASLIYDNFKEFACGKDQQAYQKILLLNKAPLEHLNGKILVRTKEVIIVEGDDRYIILFPIYDNLHELHISKDGRNVLLYYDDNYENAENNNSKCTCSKGTANKEDLSECSLDEMIFHALRFAFLVAAKENDMYVLHSASVLYRDKALLFSGKSGEGKTTQAKLWHECLKTPFINGDLNMIGFENDEPVVYGLPWCGTSGIYSASKYPLGGIIFIKQNLNNSVIEPREDEKKIMFLQRIISPLWTDAMLESAIEFTDNLVMSTNVFRLYCTKDEDSVKIMENTIDKAYY